MILAIICMLVFSAPLASAETIIIEYPDHYYVESTGSNNEKSTDHLDRVAPTQILPPAPSPEILSTSEKPATIAERQKALSQAIEQAQKEQLVLSAPQEGETTEQTNARLQESYGKSMKIKKMLFEQQKLADQNNL